MLVMKAQVQEKNCLPTMHYLQLQTSQFVFIMEDLYALCSSVVWDESPHDENVRTAYRQKTSLVGIQTSLYEQLALRYR